MVSSSQSREYFPILRLMLIPVGARASLFVFLLLISCLERSFAQVTGDDSGLKFSSPASVLLRPGKTVTLRLDTTGSEAVEIFLDTAAQGVYFHIVSDDGAEIQSGLVSTYGWTALPLAIRVETRLQLQLTVEDAVEGLPGVRVRAQQLSISSSTLPAHIRAAQTFSSAQLLHRSLRAEDLRQAILQFQQAADEWGRCGDLYGEALALGGKGESEIELSRYKEGLSSVKQALGLSANNAYVRGWLNHLAARVYLDQWQPSPAREFAQETLRLGKDVSDPALIALGHTDLVGVAYWSADARANEIDDQAHTEAIEAGVPETLGFERQWKGWLEENDEHNLRAATLMSEAEAYFHRAGDSRTGLEVTGQLAEAINFSGNLSTALSRLLELELLTKATGNFIYYGILTENIGEIHLGLGKPRFAKVYFQLAEGAYARAHFQHGLMAVHGDLCEVESRLNQVSTAVSDCALSLKVAKKIQDPVFIGIAEYQLGLADRKAGKLTRAREDSIEAVRNSNLGKDLRSESKERILLGEMLDESGKPRDALDQFLAAERLVQDVTDPTSLLEAQYSVAHRYARAGQYEKAHAELKPALEKLEAARQMVSQSTLRATYFAAERKCYELAVELRMREFGGDPSGEGDALELSEQGRARGLLDAQAEAMERRERGDMQANLLRSSIAVDRAFDHRLKLLVNGGAKRDMQASATELTQALGDLERAGDAAHAAANAVPKPAPTMSAAAIQQASLDSSVTFFEYALGEVHSYLWVIGGGKQKSFVLPPRGKLEGMVDRWRALAGRGSQTGPGKAASAKLEQLSADLSCALLADAVKADMTRMVVVPDGALAMLPFAALPERGCSKAPGAPLVVGHEIMSTPSLSVFLSRKRKAERGEFRGQVAIIADPVFDLGDSRAMALKSGIGRNGSQPLSSQAAAIALPRLLNAGYEAAAIQEVVTKAVGKDQVFLANGFDANLDTMLNPAMADYRIWHLATHGIYDDSMPEFSGLVFSLIGPDGSARFGLLKAQDITRLNVSAELVVLSACDSAAGENLGGEGVMGLSYSFLHAGAKQVVSTLWSIDDAKSRELMVAFYRELMRNGGNTAAALRQSQLAVMHQRHSSALYYWAGFQLMSLRE